MRAVSTETIYDETRPLIQELYTNRYLENPRRALAEIRLYHLPIVAEGVPLIRDEYQLLFEKQYIPKPKQPCPSCNQVRPLYGEHTLQCLECWSITVNLIWRTFPIEVTNFQQIVNSPNYIQKYLHYVFEETWAKNIIAATVKELIAATRAALHSYKRTEHIVQTCWSTPKKNFLASEIGCLHCGYTLPYKDEWIWSADTSNWTNGYCPACRAYDRAYQEIWGMPPKEYAIWQDSYGIPAKFHRTIARYGALSLLLVSTSSEWTKYVRAIVPSTESSKSLDIRTEYVGHVSTFLVKAKSLNDLGIKL